MQFKVFKMFLQDSTEGLGERSVKSIFTAHRSVGPQICHLKSLSEEKKTTPLMELCSSNTKKKKKKIWCLWSGSFQQCNTFL